MHPVCTTLSQCWSNCLTEPINTAPLNAPCLNRLNKTPWLSVVPDKEHLLMYDTAYNTAHLVYGADDGAPTSFTGPAIQRAPTKPCGHGLDSIVGNGRNPLRTRLCVTPSRRHAFVNLLAVRPCWHCPLALNCV
jgi:hypothetical protein